jgi:hypothetical protein
MVFFHTPHINEEIMLCLCGKLDVEFMQLQHFDVLEFQLLLLLSQKTETNNNVVWTSLS